MTKTTKRPGWLAKAILDRYAVETRGGGPFLTDAMRRAFLANAMYSVMLAQYGSDGQSGQDKLVDAYGEALDHLGL